MILQAVPNPEDTRDLLQGVTNIMWTALEVGLIKAREYFDQEGTEIDPWLAANITRYHAKIHLEAHELDGAFDRTDLLNCGLRVFAVRNGQAFDIWIRKSDDGEMPVPQSQTMKNFFHQPVMHGFYPEVQGVPGVVSAAVPPICLLLLWETPKNYSHITSVTLTCPAAGGESKADLEAHWEIPLAHPVTTFVAAEPLGSEEPAADLDIEQEADEATGENNGNE